MHNDAQRVMDKGFRDSQLNFQTNAKSGRAPGIRTNNQPVPISALTMFMLAIMMTQSNLQDTGHVS